MAQWLRPGGIASHVIDFQSHGMTSEWNAHWAIDDRVWHIMRGRRLSLLNRLPYAAHLAIAAEWASRRSWRWKTSFDGLIPADFAPRLQKIGDEDARTAMVFVILRKDWAYCHGKNPAGTAPAKLVPPWLNVVCCTPK
jgi:hypothetical protein